MTSKKSIAKNKRETGSVKGSTANCKPTKLPPDPDGLFERAAERARIVIAMYDALNPFLGRDSLVHNLLHDLMHLCDRDAELGEFDDCVATADYLYESLVEESVEMERNGLVG